MMYELDDVGSGKDLAFYRLEIAKEDLAAAERNYRAGDFRTSNNRAYYAIFRAISACLALELKGYKHHSQVIGHFNKDFIHTGIFPKTLGKKISRAQEIRHASDYDDFYILSIQETEEQLQTAKEVVSLVDEYFQNLKQDRSTYL